MELIHFWFELVGWVAVIAVLICGLGIAVEKLNHGEAAAEQVKDQADQIHALSRLAIWNARWTKSTITDHVNDMGPARQEVEELIRGVESRVPRQPTDRIA